MVGNLITSLLSLATNLITFLLTLATNLITSLLSLATNLLPSITASAHAPSSSSSSSSPSSNNSERGRTRAVEEDLESLKRTLERIKATLYDAEEREIRDCSVKLRLKELRKVAYDAEDVLSEYQYEVTRVQVEARKASEASDLHKREQIEYIVPIPDGIVDRLNKIRSQFDEIAKDREALQLRESDGARRPNNKLLQPPTGHMVDVASIFGRDAEIKKVINLLLSEKEKPFSVISIIGKGGLGKTTIAQLVYKDNGVSRCFDLNGWVCVSEEFDVRRVIKATIESFSKLNCGLSELSQLQEELAKTVKGKTILLVLDDVWNENRKLWELFRVPFKEARMVRILVTTRNKKVAKVMETTTCFEPRNLSEYSCWQLFEHYAFSGTSYTMPKHFVDMGREITKKCCGLPLAVKSIASLLRRYETDEEVWREILESDLWEIKESEEEIFPALQISYAHLPAHLKPCFLFCSTYPKDYVLRKMDLIRSWIAHGYIESRRNREITEIGVEYYNELKERSFLDDADMGFNEEDNSKLHDIIHDLARLNSENEHYSVEINQPLDIQERTVSREVYHLYVGGSMGLGYVNRIPQENMKGLRTIIIDMRKRWVKGVTLCNLTKFEVLRVLILKWDSLTKIPHSISELKHLTYLHINSDRLKMLPLSIGLLYNLLDLQVDCYSLKYLPKNIGDLANLQFLRIYSPGNLKEIPKSLCSLTNLLELTIDCQSTSLFRRRFSQKTIDRQFLEYVPHGLVNFPSITKVQACWKVRTIGWLKDMKDLKGMLCIQKLKNINNLEDAKRANLRNKSKLEILQLNWDYKDEIVYSMDSQLELKLVLEACEGGIVGADDVHFSLLECLQPHRNLKKLLVSGYPSTIVPGWMTDPLLLQSIEELELKSCGIQSLPFGNLHTLKYLYISEYSSIRTIQLEQLPSQLENFKISRCDHLELITGFGHLDMLKELSIRSCTTLKSLTMDGLQLVESTELFGDLSHEIPRTNRQSISSLTRLKIEYCGSLLLLPDWLISYGPCDVLVNGCGCPCYRKSNQSNEDFFIQMNERFYQYLSDEYIGSDEDSDIGSDEDGKDEYIGSVEDSDIGSDEDGEDEYIGSVEDSDIGSDEDSDIGSDEDSDINNLEDAKRANLRNKSKLEILMLSWGYFIETHTRGSQLKLKLVPEACEGGADDVHFSLLECLQPHPNLKELIVSGYPSTIVPGWMSDPLLLQSIEKLHLNSCGYIQSLPFGNLSTLKYLSITECSSIRTIQLEQLPSQLENIIIDSCDHLELITGFGHLDMLKKLSIYSCKTLKSLTMDGLQLVESTELFGDLSHEIPQINRQSISSLRRLEIISCGSLLWVPDWLIPSGPCYVLVRGCGCPDYRNSYQSDEGSDQSLSDEYIGSVEDSDIGSDEDSEDELDQLTYDNDCT